MGSLLTEAAYAKIKQGIDCSRDEECTDFTSSILHGTRGSLVFRSTNPRFKMQIPINKETLIGDYAGAIRWSPTTGKLHLCYGHVFDDDNGLPAAGRPLLSMIVEPDVAKKLWAWYESSGRALFQKRKDKYEDDDVAHRYADIYGLPGATVQLSYQEIVKLDADLKQVEYDPAGAPRGIGYLAKAPSACPSLLGEGCNDKSNMMHVVHDDQFDPAFSKGDSGPSSGTRKKRSGAVPDAFLDGHDDHNYLLHAIQSDAKKKKSRRGK